MAQQAEPANEDQSSWILSLANTFWASSSNKDDTNNDEEEKKKKDEDNDIMNWFNDIVADCDSNKNKRDILCESWSQLSNNNILGRFLNSTLRNAANNFGKLSHLLDLSYPPQQKLRPIDMSQDNNINLMNEIKYCVRHALASYKKIKLALRTKENVIALHSTKTLLRDYFGIPLKDIIIDNSDRNLKQFRNKLHSPRFYLAIDHKNMKIVLSIRGTATTADRITDINGSCKDFNAFNINGKAHEGIMAASKYIFENVTIHLVKQCKKYSDYQVIITGHSLGGGVSAMLGLMYYNHPIICKQNKLKVFAFASPPFISQEFVDRNIGIDYIISIALSTDFITRLSIESVKQYNLRSDLILQYEQDLIDECMTVLDDGDDNNLENERIKFLTLLKSVATPNPDEQLFPLGRILWFLPLCVMKDDVVVRRKCLMQLNENENENENDVNKEDKEQKEDEPEEEEKGNNNDNSKGRLSLSGAWNKLSNKMSNIESRKSKKVKQYGPDKYVLCDATESRGIFQEFVIDFPESFLSHLPSRYMWACGTTITQSDM